MKKSLLFVPFAIILLIGNCLFAQTNKTLNVAKAGSLSTLFTNEERTTIDSLVLKGTLDARDFRYIRDSLTALAVLDIREVTIAEYEGVEGTLYGEKYLYSANTFPAYAFYRSYISQKLVYEGFSFIPDGGKLNGVDACYETSVNANAFGNAKIQSKDDILSVGVKMEHSALGDLIINLQCPNGKVVSLKKMTWNNAYVSGNGFSEHRYMLGIPYGGSINPAQYDDRDFSNPDKNPAGIPWQYCWSNNENYMTSDCRGVMDTNDLQLSYRLPLVEFEGYEPIPERVLIPSDYKKRSGFFQPAESFDSLVGCPINGEWKLIVCDDIALDNGWISEWYIDFRYKNADKKISVKADDQGSKTSLVSIYLPLSIDTIGEYAFYGCTGLENITILSSTPPVAEENAFSEIENLSDINLYVPEEALTEYNSNDTWKEFSISAIKTNSLKKINIDNSNIKIYPNPTQGKIQIDGLSHLNEVKVYNILGELIINVHNQSSIDISAYPNGLYFIKMGNNISKIIKQSN